MRANLKNTTINSVMQPGGCDGQWRGQARAVREGASSRRSTSYESSSLSSRPIIVDRTTTSPSRCPSSPPSSLVFVLRVVFVVVVVLPPSFLLLPEHSLSTHPRDLVASLYARSDPSSASSSFTLSSLPSSSSSSSSLSRSKEALSREFHRHHKLLGSESHFLLPRRCG